MIGSGLGRRFWLLWSATTVANLGDGISLTAFPLLAIHLTDDARLVALVATFRVLPFVIVGLPAGVLLDRRPLALSVAVFAFMGEATNAVFVILATERFGFGSFGFGVLLSLDAAAAVTMSFFVARIVGRRGHANSMKIAVVAFSLAAVLLGFTTVAVGAIVAQLIQGAGDPTWNVVSSTIRQRLVPDQVFGRMMTAYLFIAWGIQPIGAFLGGVIAEAYGAQWVYVMAAIGVSSLLVLARPMFRQVTLAMAQPSSGAGSIR